MSLAPGQRQIMGCVNGVWMCRCDVRVGTRHSCFKVHVPSARSIDCAVHLKKEEKKDSISQDAMWEKSTEGTLLSMNVRSGLAKVRIIIKALALIFSPTHNRFSICSAYLTHHFILGSTFYTPWRLTCVIAFRFAMRHVLFIIWGQAGGLNPLPFKLQDWVAALSFQWRQGTVCATDETETTCMFW